MAITVLSMDPGTTNFAASVVRLAQKDDKLKMRIVGTRIVENTISIPAEVALEARAFCAEIYTLEHLYGPFDLVVAERFQARGLKGTTIESINMMLGALAVMYPNLQVYTAATWKNAFNRKFDLKELYADLTVLTKPTKKSERHTIHELDCSLMGIYHACKHLDLDTFHMLEGEGKLTAFLNHFNSAERL